MISIGEFSHVTELTVKTLRFYHREQILEPARVDPVTGYRYYDGSSYIRALQIEALKQLGFTIREIKGIVAECREEEELQEYIDAKRRELRRRIRSLQAMERQLIAYQRRGELGAFQQGEIEERELSLPLFAAIPLRGRYEQIGAAFQRLFRELGEKASDAPYGFYYELEFSPEHSRFEAVLPVIERIATEGIEYRSFPPARTCMLLHRGAYGSQGPSYMKLFNYCRAQGYTVQTPLIEHYIKGPQESGEQSDYVTELYCLISGGPAASPGAAGGTQRAAGESG
jgi:DNA-binding transcriptional MerR regulator